MEQFAPLQHTHPLTRLFLFLALVFMSMAFGAMVGSLIAEKFFHYIFSGDSNEVLQQAAQSPNVLRSLKVMQVLSQLFGLLMPAVFFARLVNVDVGGELNLYNKALPLSYVLGGLIMLSLIPFINFSYWLNNMIDFPALLGQTGEFMKEQEEANGQLTSLFLAMPTIKSLLFMIVVIGIVPAIAEEFVFRGIFQKAFTQMVKNTHGGIWLAAIVFSASHFQFYGFVPRMLMGAVLGYMLLYSRTLWVPIVGHAVNNTFGVLARYFGWDKTDSIFNPETTGIEAHWYMAIVSVLIAGGFMFIFRKKEMENNSIPVIITPEPPAAKKLD